MIVGIVGLGLIGGSFARAYQAAGHTVLAADIDTQMLKFAQLSDVINGELTRDKLCECDIILICTFEHAAIEYLRDNGEAFGKKPVVIDCCGIKREIVQKGMEYANRYGFTFIGGHPMAGTQFSGFKYSKETMFNRASMVIVPPTYDDAALLNKVKELLAPAGFGRITVTTAEKHDEMIAYTSQLAHVVSNAYIKSPTVKSHKGLSAGSYRDMTRVARMNPVMWTELCMSNRDYLIGELDYLMESLKAYREALADEDSEKLEALFAEGNKIKVEVDGN